MQRHWVVSVLVLAVIFVSCDTDEGEVLPSESPPQRSPTDVPVETSTLAATPSQASQLPSETPITSPAATGWLEYKDEELGFSFSYPADRKLTDVTDTNLRDNQVTERILVLETGYDVQRYVQISVARGDVADTLEDWMVTQLLCDPDLVVETTIGNNYPALLCEPEPGRLIPAFQAAFRHRDKIISVYSLLSPEGSVEESALEAIIASIRLADA